VVFAHRGFLRQLCLRAACLGPLTAATHGDHVISIPILTQGHRQVEQDIACINPARQFWVCVYAWVA
jgi:hypothetical protein